MYKNIKIFIVCSIVLAVSLPVLAQMRQPNECCKARTSFTLEKAGDNNADVTITKGNWIGPPRTSGNYCDTDGNGENDDTIAGYKPTEMWGMLCLLDTIFNIMNWLFYLLTFAVTLMIIYGGFTLLTAQGDPGKSGKGKAIVTYAIIGLAVALVAKIIPSVVKFVMGV